MKDIDPVAFALERVKTYVGWAEEHRASFEDARASDSVTAEAELVYLADVTQKAQRHVARLVELLLAGYTIDPTKRLPREFARLIERQAMPNDGSQSV